MTLETIRRKTRELHAKTRRELLGNIVLPLVPIFFYAVGPRTADPIARMAFAGAIAWSLAGQYFLNRGIWSAMLPGDAGLNTGIEFYRREIERRRNLARRVLQWSFGPILLAVVSLILQIMRSGIRRWQLPNMIPFLSLFVIWVIAFFAIRMWRERELQREIDELDVIERENRQGDRIG